MTRCHSSHFAFACRSFYFGFTYRELHCLKVVELVLVSLVVNYILDLMMCVIICYLNYIPVYSACFSPHLGRQPKQAAVKNKILVFVGSPTNIKGYIGQLDDDYKGHASAVGHPKALYIHWLTDEYMSPYVTSAPRPLHRYIHR
jgi:hypothetical protein